MSGTTFAILVTGGTILVALLSIDSRLRRIAEALGRESKEER